MNRQSSGGGLYSKRQAVSHLDCCDKSPQSKIGQGINLDHPLPPTPMFARPTLAVLTALFSIATCGVSAEPVDFARDVAPLIREHCIRCHNETERSGEMSLATAKDMLDWGALCQVNPIPACCSKRSSPPRASARRCPRTGLRSPSTKSRRSEPGLLRELIGLNRSSFRTNRKLTRHGGRCNRRLQQN